MSSIGLWRSCAPGFTATARMTGSVIDGEDGVQEASMKAVEAARSVDAVVSGASSASSCRRTTSSGAVFRGPIRAISALRFGSIQVITVDDSCPYRHYSPSPMTVPLVFAGNPPLMNFRLSRVWISPSSCRSARGRPVPTTRCCSGYLCGFGAGLAAGLAAALAPTLGLPNLGGSSGNAVGAAAAPRQGGAALWKCARARRAGSSRRACSAPPSARSPF
jgi:hypothetical protein